MRSLAALGVVGGLCLLTLLVVSEGAGTIWHSTAALGWAGFALVVCCHLGLIVQEGLAWWLLGRGRPDVAAVRLIWGRLIRDSASEALPLSQIGGFVMGARAAALAGVASAFSAASTVVDVTVELVAQLFYIVFGLVLLEYLLPHTAFAGPVLVGTTLMAAMVVVFIAVQARGAGIVERSCRRLAAQFLGSRAAQSDAVQAEILTLHSRRAVLLVATCVHLVSWLLSGVETWLTLRLIEVPLSLPAALVIDSMLYGIRSVAFMVPNAIGVQEGGLVFLGSLFGVGPEAALALSFIKRGRDLAIGLPALMAWQVLEGRRAWTELASEAVAGTKHP